MSWLLYYIQSNERLVLVTESLLVSKLWLVEVFYPLKVTFKVKKFTRKQNEPTQKIKNVESAKNIHEKARLNFLFHAFLEHLHIYIFIWHIWVLSKKICQRTQNFLDNYATF